MRKINVADIITYALLALATGLCGAGIFLAYPEVGGMVTSGLACLGFLGIAIGLIVTRWKFRTSYNYWTKNPKMGFRGKPCWDRPKAEVWIEAVIIFWERNAERELEKQEYGWVLKGGTREKILKALDGLTVYFRKDPWKYFNRMVVGVASHDFIAVRYEADPWSSAFAHELGHVLIGKIAGDWNEKTSHDKMKAAGFTNEAVRRIANDLVTTEKLWEGAGLSRESHAFVEKEINGGK